MKQINEDSAQPMITEAQHDAESAIRKIFIFCEAEIDNCPRQHLRIEVPRQGLLLV